MPEIIRDTINKTRLSKRIVLMCRDELVEPFKQNSFEVFWSLPFVYLLFYEGNDRVLLKKEEFRKRLSIYRDKISQFKPLYFFADQWFFLNLFARLRHISNREMLGLWAGFIDVLNKEGIVTIICCQDDPAPFIRNPEVLSLTHKFQIVVTHSMQMEARYRKYGQKVIYFPSYANISLREGIEGYNTLSFGEKEGLRVPAFDVFFIGAMNLKRRIFFWRLSKKINDLDYFFGEKKFFYVNRRRIDFDPADRRQLPQIYQKASINIIYGASDPFGFIRSWGASNRLFNIGYCGGFFLCDYRRHLGNIFDIDPKLYSFRSVAECHKKIRFYLKNEHLRRELAAKIHKQVMEHYTIEKAIKKLIEDIEVVKNKT